MYKHDNANLKSDQENQTVLAEFELSSVHRTAIVKQLDSLSTSEQLKPNVSNECISKVGACLYTNHYIRRKGCAAW
jgi:hypothetical protein